MRLYDATHGSSWRNNTFWRDWGSPCSEPWFAITCENGSVVSVTLRRNGLSRVIPANLTDLRQLETLDVAFNSLSGTIPPDLSLLSRLSLLDVSHTSLSGSLPSQVGLLTQLNALWAGHSRLGGWLPTEIGLLTRLTGVYVDHNSLSGTIPSEIMSTALRDFNADENYFALPPPEALHEACLSYLLCAQSLPPLGCAAFADARLSWSDSKECTNCSSGPVGPALMLAALLSLIVAAILVYRRLVMHTPQALIMRWLSTAAIILNHCALTVLVLRLNLDWPPFVIQIYSLCDLNILSLTAFRPECLFGDIVIRYEGRYGGRQGSFGWAVMSVLQIGTILVLMACATIVLWMLAQRAQQGKAAAAAKAEKRFDKLVCFIASVLALQLMGIVHAADSAISVLIIQMRKYPDESWASLVTAACCTLVFMLLALVGFVYYLALNMRDFHRGVQGHLAKHDKAAPQIDLKRMPRLQKRLYFYLQRDAHHAPYWQLVLWARQLLVLAVVSDTADALLPSDMLWERVSAVALIISGSLAAHRVTKPFTLALQNALETAFLSSCLLLLLLGSLHEAVSDSNDSGLLFEFLQALIALGVLALAIAFGIRDFRQTRQDLFLEYLAIDKPIHARLADGTIRLLRCSWLLGYQGHRMPSCQELGEDAFFPKEEAASLFRNSMRAECVGRRVLVLSYGWLSPRHPECADFSLILLKPHVLSLLPSYGICCARSPTGQRLKWLQDHLYELHPNCEECGLFWDWCSLPQRHRSDPDQKTGRVDDDEAKFNRGLCWMANLYASPKGTCVIQMKDIPGDHRTEEAKKSDDPDDDYNGRAYDTRGCEYSLVSNLRACATYGRVYVLASRYCPHMAMCRVRL